MHFHSHYLHVLLTLCLTLVAYLDSKAHTFQSFKNATNIDEKCNIAEQLVDYYMPISLDSAKMVGESLLVYSNKLHNKKGINLSYLIIGNYLVRTSKEHEGLELLRKARNYYIGIEDFNKVTEVLNEIGNGYSYIGKHAEACKWYEQSIKYGKIASEENLSKLALINWAQALLHLKKFDQAKAYAEEYKDWALKLCALKATSNAFAVLGDIELQQENFSNAIYYFEQCFKFSQRAEDNMGKSHAYTNIGIVKFLQGDLAESDHYFLEALNYRLKLNNIALICESYLNYGGIKFERNSNEEAIAYYQKGLEVATSHKRYADAIEFIGALKEVYEIVDVEKLNHLSKEEKALQEKMQTAEAAFKPLDDLLAKELRESDRIRKGGFLNSSSRVPFYAGAFALFLGFLFLAFRRNFM